MTYTPEGSTDEVDAPACASLPCTFATPENPGTSYTVKVYSKSGDTESDPLIVEIKTGN